MPRSTVNEVIARPARTAPQAVVAFSVVEFLDSFITDLSEKQYGSAVGLFVVLMAGVQILVERGFGKSFMRRDAEVDQAVPIVGAVDPTRQKSEDVPVWVKGEHPAAKDSDLTDDELFIAGKHVPANSPYIGPDFDGSQERF